MRLGSLGRALGVALLVHLSIEVSMAYGCTASTPAAGALCDPDASEGGRQWWRRPG
ncbi:hypothetical protein [Streptomyces noursei]|uniref:hypothetical protein n=1 Tax=Streptomyces noursei TaxID=1971 RepID=UPI0015E0E063|nr:hypothetical protein [Streptomyces noursei]